MNTLVYHCSLYFKAENGESMKDAADRLERVLEYDGLDFQYYDMELRDQDGNTVDEEN